MALKTDVAVLVKEAGNFERISGELQAVIRYVESTGEGLRPNFHGVAGTAAQTALLRFQEAATRQINELNEISANIQTAGVQYGSTDEDQAGNITGAMGI